jgi:hypothetical protein
MSLNPKDFHFNVKWQPSLKKYRAECVEFSRCVVFNEDINACITEAQFNLGRMLDELENKHSLSELLEHKCPCCREYKLLNGKCIYCDYEESNEVFSD